MPSKVELAKINQCFRKKPEWPVCGNCENFTFDSVITDGCYGEGYIAQKNLRCNIGGFKVGKTDTCKMHRPEGE